MKVLVIGCSLNPQSHSQVLAREAGQTVGEMGAEVELIDLRDWEMPLCDGGVGAELDPAHGEAIRAADAVLLSVPIYNYAVSAATKNLVELTGGAWRDQVVGFLCAAGGGSGYMSVMGLANSLMLDYRCVIVPRFVYATHQSFEEGRLISDMVRRRLHELGRDTIRIGGALRQ